jgi:phospholipid/cholesterol/gamma-HCH transport system substrate-binding protein
VTARRLIIAALAGGVVAVAAILIAAGAGKPGYEIRLQLSDAQGLRDGSKVVMGGVQVGQVNLTLGPSDQVQASLSIDRKYAPIGRDASAAITSVNLLGEKSVDLDPGDRSQPAPSGYVLPAARITPSTDLDQVLDVLGPDTRAQLAVLINEAGEVFTGRRADFSTLLGQLPTSLVTGTELLQRLDGDHRTLADLVAKSESLISAVAAHRSDLDQLVNTFGQTAQTVAARDGDLRQTLSELPGTLQTAQGFLGDLRRTTVPLGPAALDIQRTAPPLSATLTQLAPFTAAATPALSQAITTAPSLTRLAAGATPVLQSAVPTLASLSQVSSDLTPVSHTLMLSADNIVATAANWAHAIQFRDGLSHVFRAEVAVTAQTITDSVDRLLSSQNLSSATSSQASKSSSTTPTHPASGSLSLLPSLGSPHTSGGGSSSTGVSAVASAVISKVTQEVQHLIGGGPTSGTASGSSAASAGSGGSQSQGQVQALLKYLLGP